MTGGDVVPVYRCAAVLWTPFAGPLQLISPLQPTELKDGVAARSVQSSVSALNSGPERAMKQIIPHSIPTADAWNSSPEKAMTQIMRSGISTVYALISCPKRAL